MKNEFVSEKEHGVGDLKTGDDVKFLWKDKEITGKIYVIDKDGGGAYWGICSSVDIMGDDGSLYKHVQITDVDNS